MSRASTANPTPHQHPSHPTLHPPGPNPPIASQNSSRGGRRRYRRSNANPRNNGRAAGRRPHATGPQIPTGSTVNIPQGTEGSSVDMSASGTAPARGSRSNARPEARRPSAGALAPPIAMGSMARARQDRGGASVDLRANEAASARCVQDWRGGGGERALRGGVGGRGSRGRGRGRGRGRRGDGSGGGIVVGVELSDRLVRQVAQGKVECVICLERVKRGAPIWSCRTCFVITHLHCARKWGRAGGDDNSDAVMVCPSCRSEQGKVSELEYRCFCGKRANPVLEPGVLPGSCGDPCLKMRGAEGSACPHKCNALCHPGPCAPCEIRVDGERCVCGKQVVFRKCGDPIPLEGVRCDRVCGRIKECGHECRIVCHDHDADGEVAECQEVVEVTCFCGKTTEKLPCEVARGGFACGKVCGKALGCGEHACERLCHEGQCGKCPTAVEAVTRCACGKAELSREVLMQRTSCLDPLPSCGDVCGKSKGCIKGHTCEKICAHEGLCGECEERVLVGCRCASTAIEVKCGESKDALRKQLLCNRKCNDWLLCRRHRCQNVCCLYKKRKVLPKQNVLPSDEIWANSSPQTATSGMTNAERRRIGHACTQLCGKDLACGLHQCDLACGHSGDCPPCGILSREPLFCACGATSVPAPVRCGTSPPTCGGPCRKVRDCGHQCPYECHPGECPPCTENTLFECVGGHGEKRFVPCHIGTKGIKCSRMCGKPLLCGVHACTRPCHGDFPRQCEPSSAEGCGQVCGLPRRTCEHGCAMKCHPGMICPDVPCKHPITVSCPCGRRQEEGICLRGGEGGSQESGDAIRLACDDECAAQARLRAFASAVGRDGSSNATGAVAAVDQENKDHTKYSDFLFQFADREPGILAHFESEFAKVVKGRQRKIVLENMPQLHRLVVHTLAELYMLDSESSGKVPNKTLVVRHRGAGVKPVFPRPLLSEALVIRERERRRMRQLESGRTLLIHVPSTTRHSGSAGVEARVESELRSHAGSYHISGRATMSSNLIGVTVEFSTPERALLARTSLIAKSGVTVEIPSTREQMVGRNGRPNAGSVPLSEISECTSWNDGGQFNDHGLRNGLPSPPPAQSTVEERAIPDSWDD